MNFNDDNSNSSGNNLTSTPDNSKTLAPAQVQILKQQSERITQLEQENSGLKQQKASLEQEISSLKLQKTSLEKESSGLKQEKAGLEQENSSLKKEKTRMMEEMRTLLEKPQGVSSEEINVLLEKAVHKITIGNGNQLQAVKESINDKIDNIYIPRAPQPPFWWHTENLMLINLIVVPIFILCATFFVIKTDARVSIIPTLHEQISRIQWNVSFPEDRVGLTTPFQEKWDNQWTYELNEQKKAAEAKKE